MAGTIPFPPGGVGGLGSGPAGPGSIGLTPPKPEDCPDIECTICGCPDFVRVSTIKAISVLQMPPHGGNFEMTKIFCSNCHWELDMERGKKWAFLTAEERLDARTKHVTALKEKAAKGEKNVPNEPA